MSILRGAGVKHERRECKIYRDVFNNEMKKAYSLANKNPNCTAELIKLCAMVSDFSLGNQLIKELSGSIAVDEYLANSIAHLQK